MYYKNLAWVLGCLPKICMWIRECVFMWEEELRLLEFVTVEIKKNEGEE